MGSRSLTPGTLRREYVCEEDWGWKATIRQNKTNQELIATFKTTIVCVLCNKLPHTLSEQNNFDLIDFASTIFTEGILAL